MLLRLWRTCSCPATEGSLPADASVILGSNRVRQNVWNACGTLVCRFCQRPGSQLAGDVVGAQGARRAGVRCAATFLVVPCAARFIPARGTGPLAASPSPSCAAGYSSPVAAEP
jgi:hypothetical protein